MLRFHCMKKAFDLGEQELNWVVIWWVWWQKLNKRTIFLHGLHCFTNMMHRTVVQNHHTVWICAIECGCKYFSTKLTKSAPLTLLLTNFASSTPLTVIAAIWLKHISPSKVIIFMIAYRFASRIQIHNVGSESLRSQPVSSTKEKILV